VFTGENRENLRLPTTSSGDRFRRGAGCRPKNRYVPTPSGACSGQCCVGSSGDDLLQENEGDLIGKSLLSERGVAQTLIKRKIPDTPMTGEQLKASRLRESALDLVHEPAADALALKIGPHDESANRARAAVQLRPNRTHQLRRLATRRHEEKLPVKLSQQLGQGFGEGRDAPVLIKFGFALIGKSLKLKDGFSVFWSSSFYQHWLHASVGRVA
jgi:hypothetical protein